MGLVKTVGHVQLDTFPTTDDGNKYINMVNGKLGIICASSVRPLEFILRICLVPQSW